MEIRRMYEELLRLLDHGTREGVLVVRTEQGEESFNVSSALQAVRCLRPDAEILLAAEEEELRGGTIQVGEATAEELQNLSSVPYFSAERPAVFERRIRNLLENDLVNGQPLTTIEVGEQEAYDQHSRSGPITRGVVFARGDSEVADTFWFESLERLAEYYGEEPWWSHLLAEGEVELDEGQRVGLITCSEEEPFLVDPPTFVAEWFEDEVPFH